MPRPNHYVPTIDRFLVKVFLREARHRRMPMTRLLDELPREVLRGTRGGHQAAAESTHVAQGGRKAA